ncbi:hypothetical protein ACG04Q_21480 [Roseateles sp. DXS20W]|uniref:Uncharacterized protein n=1 Tax=Pelomonas lactea TaxID=3299030 RepID=A0ABW7GQB8_9BURK
MTKPSLTPADFVQPPLESDKELAEWDSMPAVGRERFWLPAANRYPFRTLLELKKMKRTKSRAAPRELGRASKLARLKACIRQGRRLGFLKEHLTVSDDFDSQLPAALLKDFEGGI